MEEDNHILGEDLPLPPARLFERLAQLPGYIWDQSVEPFHSTYNHWHVLGLRHCAESDVSTPAATSSGPSSLARNSPRAEPRPFFRHHWRSSLSESSSELSLSRADHEPVWAPVVARVSSHVVRLEREFHMLRSIVQTSDPDCNHTIRPIDLIRLPPDPGDIGPLLVAIFESPGPNFLRELVAFGPAWFAAGVKSDNIPTPDEQVSLPVFLDFAIGACDCLELLHYGLKTVHGEIRGDAFHFDRETGSVKLLSTGNGARSFENILSDGWSSLSRELGVKNKLQFVAPEQTGRMPTEPDSRTDIYALGVLFWTMLIGKPAFTGADPVEVVQNVFGKKLPPVSSKRMDVPDAISAVIQKMTQKAVNERYHTISSVKRDLTQISQLLGDGDSEALKDFQIAQRDVSSFFTLPTGMFGRREEYDKVISVVERVYRRQQSAHARAAAQSSSGVGSNSSVSDGRVDSFEIASGSSDSGSFQLAPRTNSNNTQYNFGRVSTHESLHSTESSLSTTKHGYASNKAKIPVEPRASVDSTERDTHSPSVANAQTYTDPLVPNARQKAANKLRKNGKCEVITISGPAGIGKTDLVNRVQPAIRKLGYIGIARLDRARRIPFEPFAKILASLLRQIFSERDVTTDYHNSVRMALRPMWTTLHRVLELPEQLMSAGGKDLEFSPKLSVAQHIFRDVSNRGSDPSKRLAMPRLDHGQSSVEFFLSNAASKNMRLMETFLEILRTLSQFKLICVCVDDLHYADDETLELILNILRAKIPCVLIVTSRKAELESEAIKSLFESEDPNVTRIELSSLGENEIMQYVAATMHQDPNPGLTPLAAVIQEKSLGNPFYVRLMLETCYSKNCIWYSWKNSRWEFDLDRIFTEFVAPRYGEGLGLGFIAKRLQEIPVAARSILIWGALLGSPFPFSLVQKLLTSEFLYSSEDDDEAVDLTCPQSASMIRQSEADIVVGLQYLVQANLIVPGKTDDEFRFANDRLAQAATSLAEGRNVDKMHFIISQAMMKYYHDSRSRYAIARHIGLASRIVRSRVIQRVDYRKILWDAAQTASQSGARPTALWYFRHCIALLQDNPWDDNNTDVYYDETLRLHIATAEMLWSQGHHTEALRLLDEVFAHGKSAVCKARAWIVKAKIYAQMGNHYKSMDSLLTCLEELGVHLREPTTYEACDAAYGNLKAYIENADLEVIVRKPKSKDINMVTIGAVMAEAMAVTYWDDALTFYRMAIEMMNLHLFKGGFVQISIGCSHLSMISFSRFRDLEFAAKLNECALTLLDCCPEPWTQRRGTIVHNLYISHLRVPMPSTLPVLERSVEVSFTMGDPYITLISLSSMAMTRLWLGHDMGQVEQFCTESPDDIPDWSKDTRGGASLLAVRQASRALQGKTFYRNPDTIMDDEHHSTDEYIAFLNTNASNADRPRDIYWGLAMIPLFLYGHHTKVIETGMSMMDTIPRLWSARVGYVVYFYLALSLLTLHNDYPAGGYMDGDNLKTVLKYKAEVDFARSACDANYGMWSLILEALISEVRNDHTSAIQAFEAAIDHCQIHGWPMEEALALELHGEFLIRRGAKRAARSVMQDAIAAWAAISAVGKASQLTEKHEWLLKTATSSRCADIGVQTVDSLLGIDRNTAQEDMAVSQDVERDDRKHRWIEQNGVTAGERSLDISSVGLDIIDLSSILESSQVMSSELQIDKLLTKMIEIVLESCNGSDFAAIATDFDDNGFAVAATGDLETGQRSFVDGLPLSEFDDKMAQQICHYVIRTKEEVLVHNLLEDDRFSNTSEAYQNKYPMGRSVIALPIMQADHLLGVIHIEGKPNSFTQRNVVVLHLLCNQIGISLANALLFREVRRVSATNAAMIEAQKRALAQAREAEHKAKKAEAEAKHNVKLKEDAARAKSIFLANISHDLRTPMNGVIGLSELLKGTILSKEQDEYVESIRVCADTLLTLINDILDFSKLEAGKMKISTVPLNVKETISEVVRALRYTHRDRGLVTIEDLDKVPPDLVVLGDPVRLHQIFMNLLSNSYKFTPKGSITVRAKVSREGKNRVRLECAVSDTGIGIPEEQKSRLFKPFSQADSSTARSYGGSGLGLSICKAIIEDVLGGAIWLDSTPGVGTTVTFHLSFNKAKESLAKAPWSNGSADGENQVAPRPMARDLTMIPRDQIRVCIAEDNPINQKIAVKFVTGLNLQCEAYSDGRQAVEALRTRSQEGNPFHVVLMDVQMPTLDGYNATREIRKDPDPNVNEVLVIAMTASAIEGDREKCLEAGMNNYLPKPVRSTVLSEMLDNYLAPAPTYTKTRLAMRARGSISAEVGTPSSASSSGSGPVIALTPEDEKIPDRSSRV